MIFVGIGVPLLIMSMAVVMGVPFAYYLKRDMIFEATKGQSEEAIREAWYAN